MLGRGGLPLFPLTRPVVTQSRTRLYQSLRRLGPPHFTRVPRHSTGTDLVSQGASLSTSYSTHPYLGRISLDVTVRICEIEIKLPLDTHFLFYFRNRETRESVERIRKKQWSIPERVWWDLMTLKSDLVSPPTLTFFRNRSGKRGLSEDCRLMCHSVESYRWYFTLPRVTSSTNVPVTLPLDGCCKYWDAQQSKYSIRRLILP